MKKFTTLKDQNDIPLYVMDISDEGFAINMEASSSQQLSIPLGANIAVIGITPGATVFIGFSPISSPPTGSWTNVDYDLNPERLALKGNQNLYIYAETASFIKVSFYE